MNDPFSAGFDARPGRPRFVGLSWRRRQLPSPPTKDVRGPWRNLQYCVIDFEMTGLDLRRDDIISFGMVMITQGVIDLRTARYQLVKPRRRSSIEAFRVHALSDQDLADAVPIQHCADALADGLSGRVLVAHAAWIELALANRALRSRGLRFTGPVLDTVDMARAAGLCPAGGQYAPALEWLANSLHLPVHTPHHAFADALTTAELVLALAARLERLTPQVHTLLTRPTRHRGTLTPTRQRRS